MYWDGTVMLSPVPSQYILFSRYLLSVEAQREDFKVPHVEVPPIQ